MVNVENEMKMDYYVQILAIGKQPKMELTKGEFEKIQNARNLLTKFYNLTENYRIVVDSYKSIEVAKFEVEIDGLLHLDFSYKKVTDQKVKLNAVIVGYFSCARYFIDASSKIMSDLFGEEGLARFKSLASQVYDYAPEYAFIEALRNYVQHRDLPIHNITSHNFKEPADNPTDGDMVTALSLNVLRSTLSGDKKFKKKALEGMPEKINIIHCIRHHMEGLWEIHKSLLDYYKVEVDAARSLIGRRMTEYEELYGDTIVGLHAVMKNDQGVIEKKIPILLDWDDARISAVKELGILKNLSRRYVTGKIQNK